MSEAVALLRKIVGYWDSLDAVGEDDGETEDYTRGMDALIEQSRKCLESQESGVRELPGSAERDADFNRKYR